MNGEYRGPVVIPGAASLSEPSRPFTPASMDSRMTNLTDQTLGNSFSSRRGGGSGGNMGVSPRMSGRDKLNPMTKMTYRRAASDTSMDDEYININNTNAITRNIDINNDLAPDANPAIEEYSSICRDIMCDMTIITANLEDAEEKTALEFITRISGPVQDLSAFIKKYPDIG